MADHNQPQNQHLNDEFNNEPSVNRMEINDEVGASAPPPPPASVQEERENAVPRGKKKTNAVRQLARLVGSHQDAPPLAPPPAAAAPAAAVVPQQGHGSGGKGKGKGKGKGGSSQVGTFPNNVPLGPPPPPLQAEEDVAMTEDDDDVLLASDESLPDEGFDTYDPLQGDHDLSEGEHEDQGGHQVVQEQQEVIRQPLRGNPPPQRRAPSQGRAPQQGGAHPPHQGGSHHPQQGGSHPPQQGGANPPPNPAKKNKPNKYVIPKRPLIPRPVTPPPPRRGGVPPPNNRKRPHAVVAAVAQGGPGGNNNAGCAVDALRSNYMGVVRNGAGEPVQNRHRHHPFHEYQENVSPAHEKRIIPLIVNTIRSMNKERGDLGEDIHLCSFFQTNSCENQVHMIEEPVAYYCYHQANDREYWHYCRWCKKILNSLYHHPAQTCTLALFFGTRCIE